MTVLATSFHGFPDSNMHIIVYNLEKIGKIAVEWKVNSATDKALPPGFDSNSVVSSHT